MNRPVDIKGLVVGKLTVLEFSRKRSGKGGARSQRLWKCRCSCGRDHYAISYKLRHGLVTQCTECWKQHTRELNKSRRIILPDGRDRYDIAEKLGITPQAIVLRMKRGWNLEEAVKIGKRRKFVHIALPCHLCGAKVAKDAVRPWPSRGPVCRDCFIEVDKRDEAEMFASMVCPAPYLPEDPEELGSLFTARLVSGGYGRKAPSGKTPRRQEFYVEKTEVHGDKVTGTGPSYDGGITPFAQSGVSSRLGGYRGPPETGNCRLLPAV